MQPNDTLITPEEVVAFSPSHKHMASILTCPFIIAKEEKLFRNCLGWSFYESLMQDKIAYTSYTSFVPGTPYAIGDIVLLQGTLYECIQVTTGTQHPDDVSYWKIAPKFGTAANEYLWVRYLRPLLAFTIIHTSVLYRAVMDTDQGLVRKKSDNFEPAKIDDVFKLKAEYAGDIRDIINNMDAYVMANTSSYPEYIKVKTATTCGDKNDCTPRRKSYHGFNL